MIPSGWYIITVREGTSAHYFGGLQVQSTCGDVSLVVDAERWLATNPQHIGEIRQCVACQARIARRDGRKPVVLEVPTVPKTRSR
jgi:hypothetical protein